MKRGLAAAGSEPCRRGAAPGSLGRTAAAAAGDLSTIHIVVRPRHLGESIRDRAHLHTLDTDALPARRKIVAQLHHLTIPCPVAAPVHFVAPAAAASVAMVSFAAVAVVIGGGVGAHSPGADDFAAADDRSADFGESLGADEG